MTVWQHTLKSTGQVVYSPMSREHMTDAHLWESVELVPASEVEEMRDALKQIIAIENKQFGLDWEEIEEARTIAKDALAKEKP